MNELENQEKQEFILNDLESNLIEDLENNLEELNFLKTDELNIGNPDSIGETMKNIVWEQFQLQIGLDAGENFIEDNNGVNFDPRRSAHTQTTDNFAKGKIAKNNSEINYQERYDNQHNNFRRDNDGEVITYTDRAGNTKTVINTDARNKFDKGRAKGSKERKTDMDHTISAAEIIRDPAANAHLTEKEQIEFANSDKNLKEMNASHNRSKSDKTTGEWLDNPNANGQKPNEVFNDLDKKKEKEYRKNDKEAREEYENVKQKGENQSVESGKKSRFKEAKEIGKQSLKAALFSLLAELLKTIGKKIVVWFKSKDKNFNSFLTQMKEAISDFFKDIKKHLRQASDTFLTTIATAIWGPIIGTIKKAWMFIKQGYKSLKEAVQFIRNPENRNKPFSVIMLQVSKIIVAGLTVGGALVLGETIEKGLMTIPVFAVSIPVLGSIASVLGIFLGALVSGIIGAFALNIIDRFIVKKLKEVNRGKQIKKQSVVINMQNKLIDIKLENTEQTKIKTFINIEERHKNAEEIIRNSVANIMANNQNDDLFDEIDKL